MCLQPHSFLNELSDLYNSPPLNSSNSLDRDFNLWKIVSSLNKRHITVYHRSKHRFWECHKYFGLDNFLVSESVLDCTGLLRNRFGKKMKRSLDEIKLEVFGARVLLKICWLCFVTMICENSRFIKDFILQFILLVQLPLIFSIVSCRIVFFLKTFWLI